MLKACVRGVRGVTAGRGVYGEGEGVVQGQYFFATYTEVRIATFSNYFVWTDLEMRLF
jgi:hypothetical protein